MTKKSEYDHLVFIARAQPFHNGHLKVIETGLKLSNHMIVLVGSSFRSPNIRNPFTFDQRKQMILGALTKEQADRTSVLPLEDYMYNDGEWIKNVQRAVNDFLRARYPNTTYEQIAAINELKVSLIGHSKDHTSYYLKSFPTWGHIDVHGVEGGNHKLINATDIRKLFFDSFHQIAGLSGINWQKIYKMVPQSTSQFLHDWSLTQECRDIIREHQFVQDYKKQWASAPYAPIFSTVDAVVVQSGHVLMVRRGAHPGLGKLALPGGFLNQDETLLDGAIRELREETGLKVPEPVLRGSLKKQQTFDDPHRSMRGRTITNAFLFHLTPQVDLPKVKGSDDAADAFWVPISEIKCEDVFDDHYFIIKAMTSVGGHTMR